MNRRSFDAGVVVPSSATYLRQKFKLAPSAETPPKKTVKTPPPIFPFDGWKKIGELHHVLLFFANGDSWLWGMGGRWWWGAPEPDVEVHGRGPVHVHELLERADEAALKRAAHVGRREFQGNHF